MQSPWANSERLKRRAGSGVEISGYGVSFLKKIAARMPNSRLMPNAFRVKRRSRPGTRDGKQAVPDILDFVRRSNPSSFPFILLDPTGWTGLELDVITPLLRLKPGEVLVNFMTSFIRRFIKSPDPATQETFERLDGPFKPSISELQKLKSEDLDDALVEAYAQLLRVTGGFAHICKAVVLHPDIDSTHFHLIYATRNPKGVEVFKDAERAAMKIQDEVRAEAKGKKRVRKSGPELFEPRVMDNGDMRMSLRNDIARRRGEPSQML